MRYRGAYISAWIGNDVTLCINLDIFTAYTLALLLKWIKVMRKRNLNKFFTPCSHYDAGASDWVTERRLWNVKSSWHTDTLPANIGIWFRNLLVVCSLKSFIEKVKLHLVARSWCTDEGAIDSKFLSPSWRASATRSYFLFQNWRDPVDSSFCLFGHHGRRSWLLPCRFPWVNLPWRQDHTGMYALTVIHLFMQVVYLPSIRSSLSVHFVWETFGLGLRITISSPLLPPLRSPFPRKSVSVRPQIRMFNNFLTYYLILILALRLFLYKSWLLNSTFHCTLC